MVTETAVWGALIVLAAISYVVAGTSGFFTTVSGRAFTTLADTLGAGEFDNQAGSLSLLIVFVLACAGLFIPSKVFAGRGPAVRKRALSISAVVEAALLIVLSLAPSAWLTWVTGLVLGAVIGLLMSLTPFTNEKPWRRVGVPATVLLFLACSFQIMGGAEAGTSSLGWMSLLVGIAMVIGAVMIYLTPERALHAESSTTGSFPVAKARVARPPASIAKPWVPIALFGVLGATFILAEPTAVEHEYGQAGYALMLVVALLGWAIGFEMGPTFAPGMSRPRVSAFALTVSGILLIATGAIDELSGKVVLAGVVAFLVGIGVRSQVYDFSRRVGAVGGALIALLINAIDITVAPISTDAIFTLPPADVAFVVIGFAALVAGIIGLCIFDPHGMQGLSVDIVHGFRPPSQSEDANKDGVGALADRFGPGFFIAIEGGDGSGKSTQITRLSRELADEGYSVEATREPGGTELGRKIRSVLFDAEPPSARTEALLFAADRAHHVASLVDPGLEAGSIVITDRYIDSTVAYQAAGREFDPKTILALSRWATEGLIPHLTIVLDIDPEVAAARMSARGESNYLDQENQQFHQRVRQTYLNRAQKDPERYVVLDASVTQEELAGQILAAVHARLPHTLRKGSVAEAVPGSVTDAESATPAVGGTAAAAASGPQSERPDSAESTTPAPAGGADGDLAGRDEASSASSRGTGERVLPATQAAPLVPEDSPTVGQPARTAAGDATGDASASASEERPARETGDGPRARFVPVSEVGSPTDDDDGVATDKVDLGADLREDADETSADRSEPFLGRSAEDRGGADAERTAEDTRTADAGSDAPEAEDADEGPLVTDGEAETRVHPVTGAADHVVGDDDAVEIEQRTSSAATPDEREEAETTVLSAGTFRPQAPVIDEDDPDEAPTTIIETSAAEESNGSDEAATTVLPARSARQTSRERLQAQAEIERQARERVRQQRERNRNRFNGPGGSR
ncbi:dTMP kinase [Brevibacterium sp. 2SA]|uniref:dTMP kinase n=1 Tax=Brevibacterium sp. 2SA TaxID=2502198 RepID=UPI0010F844AA|nr:dTMP kinase [Brevibacterium sp. 2SA]